MIKSLFRIGAGVVVGGALLLGGFAVALNLAEDGEETPRYPIDMQYAEEATDHQKRLAVEALNRFVESCPHIDGVFESRITEPKVRLINTMAYRQELYGWPWEVHLKVVVDDDGKVASGHTLNYFMWTDGWVNQKGVGAEFCGKQPEHMKDTYVAFEAS